MNIVIFISSLTSGGAERVSLKVAESLKDKGHSVTLVTIHGTEKDFYDIPDNIERVSLDLGEGNSGLSKLTYNVSRVFSLRKILKVSDANIVVGFMTLESIIALLAVIGLKTKVVSAERNNPQKKVIHPAWSFLRKLLYRFADIHISQTETTKNWLINHTKAKKVDVIPNPVNWPVSTSEPIIEPRKFLDPDDKFLLAVGSMSHQKGFDRLIRAYSIIHKKYPNLRLFIVGGGSKKDKFGDQEDRLKSLAYELNCLDKIQFVGKAGNVADWYEAATMFVLSSRYEGFPNVLLEAMASGCACISFDCETGPREIIEDGVNGLLVPDGNIEKLSQAIEYLYLNKDVRIRLGNNAVNVRDKYENSKIFDRWNTSLESLFK